MQIREWWRKAKAEYLCMGGFVALTLAGLVGKWEQSRQAAFISEGAQHTAGVSPLMVVAGFLFTIAAVLLLLWLAKVWLHLWSE